MIWVYVTVAAVVGGGSIALLILLLRRFCFSRKQRQFVEDAAAGNRAVDDVWGGGIAKQSLHHHVIDLERKAKSKSRASRRGSAGNSLLFNWTDHPLLITEAVENGWSQFAFQGLMSSPSTRTLLLGSLCAAGEAGKDPEVEIFWEVSSGAAESMQKIKFNCGLKETAASSDSAAVIRTELPLPGPPLGNSAFPQDAYFEITVLSAGGEDGDEVIREYDTQELEMKKLVAQTRSDVSINIPNGKKAAESKVVAAAERVPLSVGLTAGGTLPPKLPGSYPASIGFNSNGSVLLDGVKLVFESEKGGWGQRNRVIGCGFNPTQKRVLFTVDSELVRVIHCRCEEFGAPMFPTLAANSDVTVLVNLGQSAFAYAPANANRTPNPCFIGPAPNSTDGATALGFEDSSELFSMGRIDAQWLQRLAASRGSHNSIANSDHSYSYSYSYNNPKGGLEVEDAGSEPEFIDLPLGSGHGKLSPNTKFVE